ncbi:hypothetical protein GEV29_10305 [Aeromicrobium sp. SMF47]|uniref:Uncharacterized protein n=1 Tax=Aeromicrobium yanjiei TaxID=2662028 RepID=A0A5Q2MFM5_9ACTN|nr:MULTISPECIES: hypothetical protein [Aeromicrobium]MRJ76930.1 hypothetical protein [Aeromicrobium yanjiei]MRK01274.1 hypothetical protein [Aeromicrobium sp. S22]QGG41944.1 hypothetical protein GEV26_11515 [Aeromicrobium yanjiei]
MRRDIEVMAGAFVGIGILHFVRPRPFERIVPKPLPAKKQLVLASGAAEIALGAMMLNPGTRRLGGLGAVGLLAAVFPANVQMTLDAVRSKRTPTWFTIGTIARLPLQAPMIRIALKAARS